MIVIVIIIIVTVITRGILNCAVTLALFKGRP